MPAKLGIIAGGGSLPAQIVEACRREQRPFFVLALKGFAEPDWLTADVPHVWVRMGAAGTAFRLLHEHGVEEVVMAGPVRRPTFLDLRPDTRAARFFARIGLRMLGDDGLLRAVIKEIEAEGFTIVGIHQVLGSEALATEGVYGRHAPDEQADADIRRGLDVARGLGLMDVGQGCVVQQGIVLAAEAVEGTDAMLDRCGGLRREGPGGVLVKARKPQQEDRADLPTVGPATVVAAHRAGLRGLAVTAGGVLIVDRAVLVAKADELGLFVVGVADDRV